MKLEGIHDYLFEICFESSFDSKRLLQLFTVSQIRFIVKTKYQQVLLFSDYEIYYQYY